MSKIYINSIRENPSLVDGIGYRTVVFLQGCYFKCSGCHNKSTWDIKNGQEMSINELANILKEKAFNKKITISGGEPLMQKDALLELLKELDGYDIFLYTGHEYEDVPEEILKYLKYIKVGRFIEELKSSTTPFVGSTNQRFIEVKHNG